MNKDLRNTLVWMVFATAIVGIAFWQAQITLAKEIAAKNKVLPPPPKTRHAVRPAAATFTGDPVADYLDRCKKGLTDQEIGWIIEDFQNAGLAFYHFNETAPDPFIIAYRAAQIRWYHDLLVDGFRLSPEQSAQASVKLRQLHEKDTAEFQQAREKEGKERNISPLSHYLFSHLVLFSPESEPTYQPWDLCTLTSRQTAMTAQEYFDQDSAFEPLPPRLVQSPHPSSPDPTIDILKTRQHPRRDEEDIVYRFFPLLQGQESDHNVPEKLLSNIRTLHPAQFKLVLLFYPGLAAELQTALESSKY